MEALLKGEWYIFLLAAILVAGVYYVGLRSDYTAFMNGVISLVNVDTGRSPSGGQFYNVPK